MSPKRSAPLPDQALRTFLMAGAALTLPLYGAASAQEDVTTRHELEAGSLDLDGAFDQYVLGVTKDVPGTRAGNQGPVGPVGWDFGNVFNGIDNVYLISDLLSAGTDMTITLD